MAGFSKSIGQLFVELRADAGPLSGDMTKAERNMAEHRKRIGLVAAGVVTAIGATATALAVKAVQMASDAEEMQSKFDAVFKGQSGSVRAWADETAAAMNRSTFAFQGYLAQLQDTFVPMGFARDQAAEMSKQLTTLAVDLASFNNASEPEVIQALTSAMVGNSEAVRKYGIDLSAAALAQEGITNASTRQEKALASLRIITRSTSDAQGDAIRTAASFENQMKGLRAQLEQAFIEIGQQLLPVAKQLVGFMVDPGIPMLNAWVEGFKLMPAFIETTRQKLAQLFPGVAHGLATLKAWKDESDAIAGTHDLLHSSIGQMVDRLKNEYGIEVRRTEADINDYHRRLADMLVEQQRMAPVVEDSADALSFSLGPALTTQTAALATMEEFLHSLASEELDAFEAALYASGDAIKDSTTNVEDLNRVLDEFIPKLRIPPPRPPIDQAWADSQRDTVTLLTADLSDEWKRQADKWAAEGHRIRDAQTAAYKRTFEGIQGAFGSTFQSMVSSGKFELDNLKDYFLNTFSAIFFEEVLGGLVASFITPFVQKIKNGIMGIFGGGASGAIAGVAGGGAEAGVGIATGGGGIPGIGGLPTDPISAGLMAVSTLVGAFAGRGRAQRTEENTRNTWHWVQLQTEAWNPIFDRLDWYTENQIAPALLAIRDNHGQQLADVIGTLQEVIKNIQAQSREIEIPVNIDGRELGRTTLSVHNSLVEHDGMRLVASEVLS